MIHHDRAIPGRLYICHACDIRACCNPAHLFLGSAQTNMDDKMRKGRHRTVSKPGVLNSQAKLTENQVLEIHRRVWSGETTVALAAEFGVSQSMASHIKQGRSWSHLLPVRRPGETPKRYHGGAHVHAALSDEQAEEIRRRLAAGDTGVSLSIAYGVSRATISRIKNHARYH